MKLNQTTRLVPNLNVSAALLAFVFIQTWTKLLKKAGFIATPFTRLENTIIQTCDVACYSISVGGGFGSFLLGLNKRTYEQTSVETEGNSVNSYKEPGLGWMTTFLFVVSFVGISALVPLRKGCKLGFHVNCIEERLMSAHSSCPICRAITVTSSSSAGR